MEFFPLIVQGSLTQIFTAFKYIYMVCLINFVKDNVQTYSSYLIERNNIDTLLREYKHIYLNIEDLI